LPTGIDGDGHIVAAAQDEAGKIYVNYLTSSPRSNIRGWQQIGDRAYPGPMTLDYNADGRLTLFMREATGDLRLWCILADRDQLDHVGSSLDATVGEPGLRGTGLARDLTP